jgi:hypothetical protein
MSFVAEGDSIDYGYLLTTPSTQCTWAQLYASSAITSMGVGSYYNFATTGAVVYSGATGGLISIYDRYMANVYPHRPTANGGDGGAVAILFNNGGINDLAYNRTAAQLLADMLAYNQRAKADGFTIWADTLLPSHAMTTLETRRLQVNAAILAGQVGADFTFNSAQAIPDCWDTSVYQPDGTHPVLKGHTLRAAYMAGKIGSSTPDTWNGQVAFAASAAAGASALSEIIGYNCPRLNRGDAFNSSTGRFTAPKAGTIDLSFIGINQTGTGQGKLEIRKNGLAIGSAAFAMDSYDVLTAAALTNVEPGDVISCWMTYGSLLPNWPQTVFIGRML